MIGVDLNPRAI